MKLDYWAWNMKKQHLILSGCLILTDPAWSTNYQQGSENNKRESVEMSKEKVLHT